MVSRIEKILLHHRVELKESYGREIKELQHKY